MEYLRGGDLYELMKQRGPFSEAQARVAIKRVLQALHELHKKRIIHRDLKTENIMLRDANDPTSVCVIDFGLAATLGSDLMSMRCGSPGYVAPEVLLERGHYGCKCDVFSAGVIFYTMLCGKPPFRGDNAKHILGKNAQCKISLQHWPFSGISEEARSLLAWMTQKDPDLRCTAAAALSHPWLCRTSPGLIPGDSILDNGPETLCRIDRSLLDIRQLECITPTTGSGVGTRSGWVYTNPLSASSMEEVTPMPLNSRKGSLRTQLWC